MSTWLSLARHRIITGEKSGLCSGGRSNQLRLLSSRPPSHGVAIQKANRSMVQPDASGVNRHAGDVADALEVQAGVIRIALEQAVCALRPALNAVRELSQQATELGIGG
jgi:hypothetical protein